MNESYRVFQDRILIHDELRKADILKQWLEANDLLHGGEKDSASAFNKSSAQFVRPSCTWHGRNPSAVSSEITFTCWQFIAYRWRPVLHFPHSDPPGRMSGVTHSVSSASFRATRRASLHSIDLFSLLVLTTPKEDRQSITCRWRAGLHCLHPDLP